MVTTFSDDMPLSAGHATLIGDRTTDYPVVMAASLLAMAPLLSMFIVLQRQVIDGLASSRLKKTSSGAPPYRSRWFVLTGVPEMGVCNR